ncbi:MAG: hypothetical protein VX741_09035 [Pseudomonadota bacterium]|nr:hypothetical protein [Pseudomonadota bacterium]
MAKDSLWEPKSLRDHSQICAMAIAPIERIGAIPSQLMQAIALTESGRWDKSRPEQFAWPWTVTAGASGKFFDTRTQAIRYVRALQAKGIRHIDVGFMQVNLKYHPNAFANLEQAFDPHVNVAYAAELLQKLRVSTLSWAQAVRHYHSSRRVQGRKYWRKFIKTWYRKARVAAEITRKERVAFMRKLQIARLTRNR